MDDPEVIARFEAKYGVEAEFDTVLDLIAAYQSIVNQVETERRCVCGN